MAFKETLKTLIDSRNLRQKEVASAISVSATTISFWLSGRQEPNPKQRKKLADFFKISEGELFMNMEIKDFEASKIPVHKVPLISWVHANQFASIEDPFPVGVSDTYIYTTTKGKNMLALQVKSDCMEPEFREGDILIIKPNTHVDNNDFVVVRDESANEATFKQYKVYGTKVILHPLNPRYQDIELDHKKRYTIVGKVVEKIKRY